MPFVKNNRKEKEENIAREKIKIAESMISSLYAL